MQKLTIFLSCILALCVAAAAQTTTTKKGSTSSTAKPQTSTKKGGTTTKTGTAPAKAPSVNLNDPKAKLGYALGMNLGTNLRVQEVGVDPDAVAQGLKDGFNNSKSLMTEDEMHKTLMDWQMAMRTQQEEKRKALADEDKKKGEEFLAANKTKEGVVTLPDGLQYKILKEGTGPKPSASDRVTCNYRGTFIDGKEFDSSKPGEPATFPLNGVIKGWTEALQLMPVGSKWQLFIPSDLAYGEGGRGPIPPNTTLVFEVELLSIEAKPSSAPAPGTLPTQPSSTQPSTTTPPPQPSTQPAKPPSPK
jgi:FKBP-type peptidyl-prolyl cis-trans isomerase FklB